MARVVAVFDDLLLGSNMLGCCAPPATTRRSAAAMCARTPLTC
jgi:hypothetical protein